MMYNKLFLILIFLFFTFASLIVAIDITGDNLEVRLLIIGPGDPVYSLFGHTGIAIKNINTNRDVFYDFGNFSFEDDKFIENFAFGHMLYIAYAAYTKRYIDSVRPEKRTITEYVLNISNEKKLKMYTDLNIIILPENRTYQYHHYNDNCSTKIRDYIDDAVDGQLRINTEVYKGSTFRKSYLRFTADKAGVGPALSVLQGPEIDKDITLWQEMFLPETLGNAIKDFNYTNSNGEFIPLVKSKNVIYTDKVRGEIPDSYTPPYGRALIFSILLFLFTAFLNYKSIKDFQKPFIFLNIFLGLILGLLGSVLFFLAAFTGHTYSYYNLNLFIISPISLLAIPLAILTLKKGNKWRTRLDSLWYIQLGLAAIMILIKVFTPVKQANLLEIIIVLPVLFALTPLTPKLIGLINLQYRKNK